MISMAEAVRVARREVPCLAKIIGGGMPVGAFGRRPDTMAQFDPTSRSSRARTWR